MKRRLVFLVLIIIFSQAVVAASGTRIEISVSPPPISYQLIVMRDKVHYSSTSGWSGKLGCSFDVGKINLGLIVQYSNFRYSEFSESYHVIGINAKLGFPKKLSEKISFDGNINVGIDIRSIYSTTRVYPSLGVYTGFALGVNEKLAITAGADIKLAIQPNITGYYNAIDCVVMGNIGLRITI